MPQAGGEKIYYVLLLATTNFLFPGATAPKQGRGTPTSRFRPLNLRVSARAITLRSRYYGTPRMRFNRVQYRELSLYSGLGFPRPDTLGIKPDSALRPGLGTPCNTWLGPTAWERSRFTSRFSRLGQLRRLRDRRRRCVGARCAPRRRAVRLRQRVLHAAAPERVARWQAAG